MLPQKLECMYLRLIMFNTEVERVTCNVYLSNSRWIQNIATCTSTVTAVHFNIEHANQSDSIHAFVLLN